MNLYASNTIKKYFLLLKVLAVLTGVILLVMILNSIPYKFSYVTNSQGFSAVFSREAGGLRGDSVMHLAVKKSNDWLYIGVLEDSDFGKRYPGSFWSKDETLIIAEDDGHELFGYDFIDKRVLFNELDVTRTLKSRGGAGKRIFRDVDEFNQISRHPWWWELSWLRRINSMEHAGSPK